MIQTVLPGNERSGGWNDIDWPEWALQMQTLLRLREAPEALDDGDAFACPNLELRRQAADTIGRDQLLDRTEHHVVDTRGPDRLLLITSPHIKADPKFPKLGQSAAYLDLTDPSTGRQYLLRVPPDVSTVDEGVAWTFEREDWSPEQET